MDGLANHVKKHTTQHVRFGVSYYLDLRNAISIYSISHILSICVKFVV